MGKRILDPVFLLGLLLASCAIPGIENAPSGCEEITVTGTDSDFIGLTLKDKMLNLGYSIREQSRGVLVFEKKLETETAMGWHSADQNVRPYSRVTFRLLKQNGTVRVVADSKIIENPGSSSERVADVTQHTESTSIQDVLIKTKQYVEIQERQLR